MPRKPPYYEPGRFYHLVAKFVADEYFIKTEIDRAYYLRLLGDALRLTDWRCFAFAVMSNHIHLGVQAGTGRLAPWLRLVHGPFAEWINQRDERGGAVFKRGPWGGEVPQDRVAHLVAYIHRNPVRAALVETAAESSWTSHQVYVGERPRPSWLDVDLGRAFMPFSSPQQFEEWVDDGEVERAVLMETRVWGDEDEAEEETRVPAYVYTAA
jgi:putative transposase